MLFYFGIFITFLFLYFAFKDIEFSAVLKSISEYNLNDIVISVTLLLFSYYVRAIRWGYIINDSSIELKFLYSSSMIGHMVNNILPLRAGEVARCYALSKHTDLSKIKILSTVALERLFDVLAIVLLFVAISYSRIEFDELEESITTFTLISIALLIALWAAVVFKNHVRGFFPIIGKALWFLGSGVRSKISKHINSFFSGFDVVSNKKNMIVILLLSALYWLVSSFAVYFILYSYIPTEYYIVVVLLAALSFGVMIPSSPGFIGTYHLIVILILTRYGWNNTEAASMSIVLHAVQYIVPVLIGWWYLFKDHISIREFSGDSNF